VVSGADAVIEGNAILIANHQTFADWWYLWCWAYTKNQHGSLRIILKSSLKHIPIWGWVRARPTRTLAHTHTHRNAPTRAEVQCICVYVCLSVCLSVCVSVCLSLSLCIVRTDRRGLRTRACNSLSLSFCGATGNRTRRPSSVSLPATRHAHPGASLFRYSLCAYAYLSLCLFVSVEDASRFAYASLSLSLSL
jgi:hypothetical protein